MQMFQVKVCDACMIGRKIGDTFSLDTKNIPTNQDKDSPCNICNKYVHKGVFTVQVINMAGGIMTLKIIGKVKGG